MAGFPDIRPAFITNWGICCFRLGQPLLLDIGADILQIETLEIGAVITNWCTKLAVCVPSFQVTIMSIRLKVLQLSKHSI